jgi:hypothetical protein
MQDGLLLHIVSQLSQIFNPAQICPACRGADFALK